MSALPGVTQVQSLVIEGAGTPQDPYLIDIEVCVEAGASTEETVDAVLGVFTFVYRDEVIEFLAVLDDGEATEWFYDAFEDIWDGFPLGEGDADCAALADG